jgi:hypothetical protein
METIMVPLWTALQVARWRKRVIPRWKRWCLQNHDRDKKQMEANYLINICKIASNSRIWYWVKKGANAGELNEQRREKSVGTV